MRGYDSNDNLNHKIVAKDANPEKREPYEPNLNPTPQEIAAQGFETIASAAENAPYSKERDVTYDTDDGFHYPMPWHY